MKVINLSVNDSIISQYVTELRDKNIQQDRIRFNTNLERVGMMMGYEISKELKYKSVSVQTSLGKANAMKLKAQPVVATILRAGLPFHRGFLQVFDKADSAFITAYRKIGKKGEMKSVIDYSACPNLDGRTLIIADTMVATGTTIVDVYNELIKYGKPAKVYLGSVIASQQALDYIQNHITNLTLYSAAIDEELDDKYYIVPGLGDAGDLAYGIKSK